MQKLEKKVNFVEFILNSDFMRKVEKEKLVEFLNGTFLANTVVIKKKEIKGVIGLRGYTTRPKNQYIVKCKESGEKYRIEFENVSTAFGDSWVINDGEKKAYLFKLDKYPMADLESNLYYNCVE